MADFWLCDWICALLCGTVYCSADLRAFHARPGKGHARTDLAAGDLGADASVLLKYLFLPDPKVVSSDA